MFSFLSDLLRWFGQRLLLTRPSSATAGLPSPIVGASPGDLRSVQRRGRETLARTSLYKEEACTRRAWSDDGFTASHCGLSGTGFLKFEKRGVQAARNAPSEDGKCWQRVKLGIHGLNK